MSRIATPTVPGRVDWVDYAKGFCIIMVVMMHSTLGVEKAAEATGFMHAVVEFAKPFRMPDFFLISGLFLARVIDRDWRTYADRKVVHFAYFYLLWFLIQGAFKWPAVYAAGGSGAVVHAFFLGFIEPFGTLWFIYLLPMFCVAAKLLRRAPPLAVLIGAAVLQMLQIDTGWTIIDEFTSHWVYFLAGWYLADAVFDFAGAVAARPRLAALALVAWAAMEQAAVSSGLSERAGIGLLLGLVGAGAVITFSVLLAKLRLADVLRFTGQHSIVVYLAFFLPMAATRALLLRFAPGLDLGTVSLIVTAVAVVTPLILHHAVHSGPFRFLFERPQSLRLSSRPVLQPAE